MFNYSSMYYPSDFTELKISLSFISNNILTGHTFYILKEELTSSVKGFISGWYYNSSDNGTFVIRSNSTKVTEAIITNNGSVIAKSDLKIVIYYR